MTYLVVTERVAVGPFKSKAEARAYIATRPPVGYKIVIFYQMTSIKTMTVKGE